MKWINRMAWWRRYLFDYYTDLAIINTPTPDTEEIYNSGNTLYVPPEMSYSETGMLYSSGASRIRKYELGFSNDLYKELLSKKGSDDSIEKIVKLHPIGGDRILTKGDKGTWELYDLSGNEPGAHAERRAERVSRQ